jgi:hypothetical protein
LVRGSALIGRVLAESLAEGAALIEINVDESDVDAQRSPRHRQEVSIGWGGQALPVCGPHDPEGRRPHYCGSPTHTSSMVNVAADPALAET